MAYAKDQTPVTVEALKAAAKVDRNFDSVPIVDFAGMLSADHEDKLRVAANIRDACARVGFFYLTNHGVSEALIERTFETARQFFAAPEELKRSCDVAQSSSACGYVPLYAEDGDLHEAFDCAAEDRNIDGRLWRGDFRQLGNQWPEGQPDFRPALIAYSDAMRQLARRLFAALALALDLPEDYFVPNTDHPLSLLRILHYPSQEETLTKGMMGAGAHTDHECFTILCTDDIRALQVQNGAGEWLFAPRIPGAFIINIGDQMSRWTNDQFVSTMHRVVNVSGLERYSIPFFVGPNHDTTIEALPSCVGPGNPARHPPLVAGEYVMENILSSFGRPATNLP